MTDITSVNKAEKSVTFEGGDIINLKDFHNKFVEHFDNRIAGETILPAHMERFMRRSSSKNLKQLVDGKKAEGYMEGALDKTLTQRQKIAIMTVFIVVVMVIIIAYALQGLEIF